MSNTTTFEDMAFDKVPDPMDRYDLIKKHDEEIEKKAQKIAESKAEGIFQAKKEVFQIEVLQQLQAEGIKKEGVELSSASPLTSDTYIVDGVTLFPEYYIPDTVVTDPSYVLS